MDRLQLEPNNWLPWKNRGTLLVLLRKEVSQKIPKEFPQRFLTNLLSGKTLWTLEAEEAQQDFCMQHSRFIRPLDTGTLEKSSIMGHKQMPNQTYIPAFNKTPRKNSKHQIPR